MGGVETRIGPVFMTMNFDTIPKIQRAMPGNGSPTLRFDTDTGRARLASNA